MYVLIHNNTVITGPINWDYGMFVYALSKENIQASVPSGIPSVMPFVIDENTRICEYDESAPPEFNPKIQMTYGPFWDLTGDKAVASFLVKDKEIEFVKGDLKALTAAKRYEKEIAGTKVTIQGVEVTVDTNRGSHDIFVQKYAIMNDGDTVKWKFPEGWLTINKTELGIAVNAGALYVQSCFDWESDKSDEIDSATTLQELDAIVIE